MDIRRSVVAATAVTGCVLAALAAPMSDAAAGPGGGGSPDYARHSLCAPPADTVAPQVSQVTFGRSSIDLNSGSRVQTVTATASDASGNGAASGVSRLQLQIRGNRFYQGVNLTRASGTPASGTWTGRFTVSKYAHAGTYSIEFMNVSDAAGNEQDYSGYGKVPDGPTALSLDPADNPKFTVTGTPAKPPARKPAGKLKSFGFSPATVDTTKTVRHVRVTAQFTGPTPATVSAEFLSIKRAGITRFAYLRAVLHRHAGGWSGELRVPRWLGDQTLQTYLYTGYGRGYSPAGRSYSPDRLAALHLPNQLKVVGGMDRSKPTLTSLSFSPNPIDSTNGAERVTVTARAKDVGSGVRYIEVNSGIQHGANGAAGGSYPLAAAGVGYLASEYLHVRLNKNASGDWVGTMRVRQCVPSGTYKLTVEVRDVAGNDQYYSTKHLAHEHITSTVEVTSKHGDVEAPYVYSAATYAPDHEIFLDFSEGVADVTTSTLTIYPLSPAGSRYTTPADVTNIECAHGTDIVDCSGSNGLVTSAALTVPSMKPGEKYDVFANLRDVTAQLVDGNGNPMDWNYSATEVKDS